jgi:hypothetical protein
MLYVDAAAAGSSGVPRDGRFVMLDPHKTTLTTGADAGLSADASRFSVANPAFWRSSSDLRFLDEYIVECPSDLRQDRFPGCRKALLMKEFPPCVER